MLLQVYKVEETEYIYRYNVSIRGGLGREGNIQAGRQARQARESKKAEATANNGREGCVWEGKSVNHG